MSKFRAPWPVVALCLSFFALSGCSDDDCPTAPTVVIPEMDAALISSTVNTFFGGEHDKSQVFRVLQTGKLMRVEVLMALANTDLQFDIRATANEVPTDSNDAVLFSKTIAAADVTPGYLAVEIPGGLSVTAGDRLAFVLRGDHTNAFQCNGRSNDIYTDGDMYMRVSSSNYLVWELAPFSGDMCFSTWVVPAAE